MNAGERVKAILLTPKTEWLVIEAEPGDAAYLIKNYVAILAAIAVIAGVIGAFLIGFEEATAGTIGASIFITIIAYVMAFVISYIVALIADGLAPACGGSKNFENALKLTVYSYTPAWLAGIFMMIPWLAFLSVLGLYAVYLFWTGAPVLMKIPQEEARGYTAAVVVCATALSIGIPALLGAILALR
jgi:hypothetical protein